MSDWYENVIKQVIRLKGEGRKGRGLILPRWHLGHASHRFQDQASTWQRSMQVIATHHFISFYPHGSLKPNSWDIWALIEPTQTKRRVFWFCFFSEKKEIF